MSLKPILAFFKANLGAIIAAALGGLWTLTVVFAESWGNERWQRLEAAHATSQILAPIPAKVERLEYWQAEQRAAQQADATQFALLVDKLTAMQIKQAEGNAIMAELVKSNDRVLRRLDDNRQ